MVSDSGDEEERDERKREVGKKERWRREGAGDEAAAEREKMRSGAEGDGGRERWRGGERERDG